MHLFKY